MAYSLKEDVTCMLRQLIEHISGLNKESEIYKHVEKSVITHIRNAETLYFTNQREMDRIMDSLCKKFEFHGLATQAKDLKYIYDKLMSDNLSKPNRLNRLNVIKFLLCVSESPTNNAYKFPKKFERGDEEDIIDWPKYLKEGIPAWSPPPDDNSSDDWSDIASEDVSGLEDKDVIDHSNKSEMQIIYEQNDAPDCCDSHHNLKVSLLKGVQSQWFNREHVRFTPSSNDKDANVALEWDDHIQNFTKGLISLQSSNIISEYKIMREVIWQLYEPHASYCFTFQGNLLLPKLNITISSVRTRAFESFLHEFVPYINWLEILREFHESLAVKCDEEIDFPPDTYRSYDFAVQTIIQPIFEILQAMENKIKDQETTVTLLMLAHELRPLFETVKTVKDIHNSVILDFKENSPLHCATTLLSRLHKGLLYASSKLEQDLFLTLYLHSLYKYFTIINSWLCRDTLEDNTGEFVIADENPKDSHVLFYQTLAKTKSQNQSTVSANKSKVQQGEQDWQMEFSIKNLDDNAKSDSLLNLICTQVLQIGKNIHLLRLLGKLHLVPEFTGIYKETFYEAYIEKTLKNISLYFDVKNDDDEGLEVCNTNIIPSSPTFVFPATCPDECKYLTEMDKLENLVDTSDGFLVQAFESFFVKKPNVKKEKVEISLFERITELTKTLFPVQQIIEHVFVEVLNERFSTSGLIVKNVLIKDYNLEKQFSFLKNVFLFNDDLIFPFYRHVFVQLDSGGVWGNHTWLTSLLQDIIMDAYPDLYKECTVEVKDSWKLCTDPLKACRMINVHYRIRWPVNIIIRDEHMEMYKNLFQFILKIKWALYTLNHLFFTELEPKGKPLKQQHKSLRILISKLKLLRFGLINIMSNIHHFILGHIFNKFSKKFDKAFEKAYDLESLMKAHNDFIVSLYKTCYEFQEYNNTSYGFCLLLYLVRKLRAMWRNLQDINDQELDKCEKSYLLCHKNIDPIINPTGYYAYLIED